MSTYIYLILTAFVWATVFPLMKYAISREAPFVVALYRYLISGLVLFLLMAFRKLLPDQPRQFYLKTFFIGLTGITLYNIFFYMGLRLTEPFNASLMIAFNPVATVLADRIFRGNRLRPVQKLGAAVSFLGVLLVLAHGFNWSTFRFNTGDLLILGSPVCWAIYSVFSGKVMKDYGSSPITMAALAMNFGAPWLFLPALAEGGGISDFQISSPWIWGIIIYTGIFASGFAYLWWNLALEKIGASRAAVFVNLIPLFVLLIGLVQGKIPSWLQILGGALIILGIRFTTIPAAVKSDETGSNRG